MSDLDEQQRVRREALLAWMAQVDVDAVILAELRRRTALGLAWGEMRAGEHQTLEAMRERWQDDPDR